MKHVGVLESNTSGSGFDGLRAAKEIGCRVTFFTSGMERYLAVPGVRRYFDDYVDEIVVCQTNALAPLRAQVHRVHASSPFAAFLSLAEYEVVDAALIAEELGLPTPSSESVRTARNKIHMRRRCAEHDVPMPAFRSVADADAAARAAAEVGLPCVVKPADETSSADVRRCATVAEVVEQFTVIHDQVENVRGQRRYPEVLIEECLSGFEVSVEILTSGDRAHVLGVTDKSIGGNNRFVELGHLFPSLLPEPVRRGCEQVAVQAVQAIGLELGLLHVEVKHTAGGPKLIEVNPRPAGDRITELIDLSLGGSCLDLVVRQYLGERVDDLVPRSARQGAAIRFLTADPGRVTVVRGLAAAAALPGVRSAVATVAEGDLVRTLMRNEDRVGHVLAVGENAYLAARTAEAAAHEISVLTVADRDRDRDGDGS
ncbi:MAG: ATP-grasp domain-containing protein [Actinobacteria bacterium]|nr:ATP-grasp domain-containing protein [Actinomycetota bacterium]MBI3686949.1 ATP-grasp domain-containing protein [Actinomycetota bacterium]